MNALDVVLFSTVSAAALALATFGFCRADWLWAVATLLVAAFWLLMILRKVRKSRRDRRRAEP